MVRGFSNITFQNQEFIIIAEKGEFKEIPMRGVGIRSFSDDESPETLIRSIRTELTAEGMKVNKIDLNLQTGKLEIDAKYN